MRRRFPFHVMSAIGFLLISGFLTVLTASSSPASSFSSALRRYPYLTDVVGSYATINWGTTPLDTAGAVRYGKAGVESCTAHYAPATKIAITVNGVSEYQWKAMLTLDPGTQYCYRVYLGTGPVGEIDLLGGDPAPTFWTQVPPGSNQTYSFLVFGDWGQVDANGTNTYQANLMSLMATSGARFAVTTGDNGQPDGGQNNFGDLVRTGPYISAIFGPSFWKVPGSSLPLFIALGNHGIYSTDAYQPQLLTWPQDRAVSMSGGRFIKETYCCLDGTTSRAYPSAWYAFDAGPARFYVLQAAWQETNVGTATAYKVDYDYHWAPGTAQYEWLKADLAAHPSVLKFAFWHYPIYSDNSHESTDTYLQGSDHLEGLLKQNGVDLAFTGHSHVYERNLASAVGLPNYITGGGGATLGTLDYCTSLDAYAIKFTDTGRACGSAPVPTSAGQVFHFLKVTINGTNVNVTPINSLGQSFDVMNFSFTSGAETTAPTVPTNLSATVKSGRQIDLIWSASSDNTSVRGYGVYRNGTLVATVDRNTLTYADTDLNPATAYSYRIDAFDGSGNHSARSTSKSATTLSAASYIFTAAADGYVASDFATTNYGSASTLKVDASPDDRAFLRFHVGDLSGTVTKATLRLYTTSSSSTGYQVRQVNDQSWEEGSITYSNAPGVESVIGTSGSLTASTWTTVDVTSLINGNGVYDLAITTTSTSSMSFMSREASSNQPQLVIVTTASAPSPTPTRTPTSVVTLTRTPTPATGTTLTLTPNADARVVQASPTTNFGTGTTLQVDGDAGAVVTSFIRFSLSGVSGSVQNVKLRVFCTTNGTANGPALYAADNNWTESGTGGINWNNQPALRGGILGNKGSFGASTWVEYDVTAVVTVNGTYTFALVADSNDGVTFSSREGTTPPQLVVTLGSGAPTATDSPTHTPTATQTPTATSGVPQNTLTFTTLADARVAQSASTTNYGASTNLQVDGDAGIAQISYLRFDVRGIAGTIQSVKLRVFCTTNGTNNGPASYLADNNWIESGAGGITWDARPALIGNASDNKGVIPTNSWVDYDVTSLVIGDGTYSFALVADSNDGVTFSSREGSIPAQLLVILAP